jgi:hypothetical protein
MLLLCGDMIPPGAGWLLRCASTPRILAAEVVRTQDDAAACVELAALRQPGSAGSSARRPHSTRSRSSWRRDALLGTQPRAVLGTQLPTSAGWCRSL